MISIVFILTHFVILSECVKTHGFVSPNIRNGNVINNKKYNSNVKYNGILNDSCPNFNNPVKLLECDIATYKNRNIDKVIVRKIDPSYFKLNETIGTNIEDHELPEDDKPLNIITPPPNLTGDLHIGNLLNLVCTDAYYHYNRLNNKWVNVEFSNDHAGQSFQKLFEKQYNKIDDDPLFHKVNEATIENLEDKIKTAHSVCDDIKNRQREDLHSLGIDWRHGLFTLAKPVEEIAQTAFVILFDQKLIKHEPWPTLAKYDEESLTPISSSDVDYKMEPKKLYTLRLNTGPLQTIYFAQKNNSEDENQDQDDENVEIKQSNLKWHTFDGYMSSSRDTDVNEILAFTTTPEYYHAVTAVGVLKEDYDKIIDKRVYLYKAKRYVPIVPLKTLQDPENPIDFDKYNHLLSDDEIDESDEMDSNKETKDNKDKESKHKENDDKGNAPKSNSCSRTVKGVLIIPAHVERDFWLAYTKGLEVINILSDQGKLQNVPFHLLGCTLKDALDDVIVEFDEVDTIPVKTPVYIPDKNSKIVTVPFLQYVLNAQKLAEEALETLKGIKVVPESRRSMIENRLKNIRNWCLSRHGWWGTRVPMYQFRDDKKGVSIPSLSEENAKMVAQTTLHKDMNEVFKDGYTVTQDNRVLDTWFTSSLWPLISVRCPSGSSEKLNYNHTRNVLFTCYDILESWIVKMLLIGSHFKKDRLFDEIYLHGMVSADDGKKMSKSQRNTVTLKDLLEEYKNTDIKNFEPVYFPSKCDLDSLIKTNLIRLKLIGMCKQTNFTKSFKSPDRSLYILNKYYQIFKFYYNTMKSSDCNIDVTEYNDNCDKDYKDLKDKEHKDREKENNLENELSEDNQNTPHMKMEQLESDKEEDYDKSSISKERKLIKRVIMKYVLSREDSKEKEDEPKLLELLIRSKLDELTKLIDESIRNFQFSNSILYLERYIKTFSDYLVPYIRLTMKNETHSKHHFDKYFINLSAVIYPFIPSFVDEFLLNKYYKVVLNWPLYSEPNSEEHETATLEMEDATTYRTAHNDINESVKTNLGDIKEHKDREKENNLENELSEDNQNTPHMKMEQLESSYDNSTSNERDQKSSYLEQFNRFEKILSDIRSSIASKPDSLNIGLPKDLFNQPTIDYIEYLIMLTFNTIPQIKYHQIE